VKVQAAGCEAATQFRSLVAAMQRVLLVAADL
jgi:hypothetical protein